MEICKFCKGTGKLFLLISEVDCECPTSIKSKSNIVHISKLQSGEVGYENPPTDIPYIIRFNNDFVYVKGSKDNFFKYPNYKFEDHCWPPDTNVIIDASDNLKVIAKNIKSLEEAKEAIQLHEKTYGLF